MSKVFGLFTRPPTSTVQGLVNGLHGLPPLAEPPRLVYAILDKTLGPRQTARGWRAALAFLRGFATMRFAYGALSVTATVIVLLTASGFNWKHPRAADLHPVNLYRAAPQFYAADLIMLSAGVLITFIGAGYLLRRIEQ